MDQLQLPLSFEDFIPENHLVRVANTVVDRLKLKRYKEDGCPAYHPRMMLKIMVYLFSQKVHSSRQIAKAHLLHAGNWKYVTEAGYETAGITPCARIVWDVRMQPNAIIRNYQRRSRYHIG